MAAHLLFDDLMDEVESESEAKGLTFTAKNGEIVLLRPLLMLSKVELKNASLLIEKVQNADLPIDARLDAVDAIMICAADRKDALKKSLVELPPAMRMRIFESWMKAADLPEA